MEVCKVTKLHYCDSTSSNDKFSSYAQSIKLIFTTFLKHQWVKPSKTPTSNPRRNFNSNFRTSDQFDQLCQWMEYKQYLTIDDFYESSYNDPEKFDTKSPATEYKWKGKMNHLSPNVAQKLKSFVRWMTHEDRPYEFHHDFLATLTRERYLKFRHMDTLSFSASSPSHHEPSKLKTSFSGESKHQAPNTIRVPDCPEQLQEGNQEGCLSLSHIQE